MKTTPRYQRPYQHIAWTNRRPFPGQPISIFRRSDRGRPAWISAGPPQITHTPIEPAVWAADHWGVPRQTIVKEEVTSFRTRINVAPVPCRVVEFARLGGRIYKLYLVENRHDTN